MDINRRDVLKAGGAVGAAAALQGLSGSTRPDVAWAAGCDTPMPAPSPEVHLLNRATFGPTRADLARLKQMGLRAWIDEQLDAGAIDDRAVEDALEEKLETYGISWQEIRNIRNVPVGNELIAETLYRAVKSKRQLFEVMVDFWSNHFNVYHPQEGIVRTKRIDDREVIRAHALGSFRDMVQADSACMSMMLYLNTFQNTAEGPNENFGRELMELHTIGPDGGYSEQDVKEVARCFTGWDFDRDSWRFAFNAENHDWGPKTVMGRRIQASGVDEGREVIDMLVDTPACARHIAVKLCRRFAADDPPPVLIARVAAAFGQDGDIKAMLRTLLNAPEFGATFQAADAGSALSAPARIRRPMEYWVAALRATEADVGYLLENLPSDAYEEQGITYEDRAEGHLARMDHLPFRWHAPDGYPDTGPPWSGTHVMLGRWNYAMDLCSDGLPFIKPGLHGQMIADRVPQTPAEIVDYWISRTILRPMAVADRQRLILFISRGSAGPLPADEVRARLPMMVAMLFDSPYFVWR